MFIELPEQQDEDVVEQHEDFGSGADSEQHELPDCGADVEQHESP